MAVTSFVDNMKKQTPPMQLVSCRQGFNTRPMFDADASNLNSYLSNNSAVDLVFEPAWPIEMRKTLVEQAVVRVVH